MNPKNLQSGTIYNQHPFKTPPPPTKISNKIFLSFFKVFCDSKCHKCALRRFFFLNFFLWTLTTKDASPHIHWALNHWMFVHTNLVTYLLTCPILLTLARRYHWTNEKTRLKVYAIIPNNTKRLWGTWTKKKGCEELLHTFTIKICIHIKPGWKWNYYVVVV
jgi:hypothetical protein